MPRVWTALKLYCPQVGQSLSNTLTLSASRMEGRVLY
jgi:hypothetical protein